MINLVRNLSVFKKNPFIGMALAGLELSPAFIQEVLMMCRKKEEIVGILCRCLKVKSHKMEGDN